MSIVCPLCEREVDMFDDHHLVPKSKKGKVTITICRPCHNAIHDYFTNNELRDEYNTVEKLRSHDRFSKYLTWIRKKPKEFYPCSKAKK